MVHYVVWVKAIGMLPSYWAGNLVQSDFLPTRMIMTLHIKIDTGQSLRARREHGRIWHLYLLILQHHTCTCAMMRADVLVWPAVYHFAVCILVYAHSAHILWIKGVLQVPDKPDWQSLVDCTWQACTSTYIFARQIVLDHYLETVLSRTTKSMLSPY